MEGFEGPRTETEGEGDEQTGNGRCEEKVGEVT